jgi:hypothetical protein
MDTNPVFSFTFSQGWLELYIRDIFGFSIHIIGIIALVGVTVGYRWFKYKRSEVKLTPLLGTVFPKEKK